MDGGDNHMTPRNVQLLVKRLNVMYILPETKQNKKTTFLNTRLRPPMEKMGLARAHGNLDSQLAGDGEKCQGHFGERSGRFL